MAYLKFSCKKLRKTALFLPILKSFHCPTYREVMYHVLYNPLSFSTPILATVKRIQPRIIILYSDTYTHRKKGWDKNRNSLQIPSGCIRKNQGPDSALSPCRILV